MKLGEEVKMLLFANDMDWGLENLEESTKNKSITINT